MSQSDITRQNCNKCGAEITPGASFCGNCGTPIPFKGFEGATQKVTPILPSGYTPTDPQWYNSGLPPTSLPEQPVKKSNKILYSIVGGLIVLVLILGGLSFHLATGQNGTNNSRLGISYSPTTQVTQPAGSGQTATVQQTPVPTATPVPATPTPSCSQSSPGTVLYQENGSDKWQNWALSTDWVIAPDGIIHSNGGGPTPSAIPPYTIPSCLTNFAVEASMRMPPPIDLWWEFGVTACGSTQSKWTGYSGRMYKSFAPPRVYITAIGPDSYTDISNVGFDPGTGWHLYRLEVKGNNITLFVDGAAIAHGIDEQYVPCGNQVGFYNGGGYPHELQVSSFKVIAI